MGGWVGEGEGKGVVRVYEAYEVGKFLMSFTSPEKDFFLYLRCDYLGLFLKNGPLLTTYKCDCK